MILYDKDPQTPARFIIRPRSILAHLFENPPRSPIIGFRAASRCHLAVTGNVTARKTPATVAESWRCIAVLLMHARWCLSLLSGFLQFPFFAARAIDSTAPCSLGHRLAIPP